MTTRSNNRKKTHAKMETDARLQQQNRSIFLPSLFVGFFYDAKNRRQRKGRGGLCACVYVAASRTNRQQQTGASNKRIDDNQEGVVVFVSCLKANGNNKNQDNLRHKQNTTSSPRGC